MRPSRIFAAKSDRGTVELVRSEPSEPERAAEAVASAPAERARDAAFVELARRGDRRAFGELYLRHGALVYGVLLARVPRADADDLTQEVFLAAWRRLEELRDGGAVAGWLVAIARSKAADWARARRRRRAHESGAAHHAASSAPDRADAVLEAIRSLPETYREALLMRLVAGMTGAQIAGRLGMTHGSARVHLHRGMKLLREKLSEESP